MTEPCENSKTHLGILHIIWAPDPFYLVSTLLDSVDKRPNIAGYVVQQMDFVTHFRCCERRSNQCISNITDGCSGDSTTENCQEEIRVGLGIP